MAETQEDRKKRARSVLRTLMRLRPDAKVALDHANAFELLIATILSAQCTDKKVNEVTAGLFRQYSTPLDFAEADESELQAILRPTGFYRNKTENVIGVGRELLARFDGRVPDSMDDLLTLPGVARKTANVVLGQWFGKPSGVVVDTHVRRLSGRLGFTTQERPEKIEEDLMALFPKGKWIPLSSVLILHGRSLCSAKKPQCDDCPLSRRCPQIGIR